MNRCTVLVLLVSAFPAAAVEAKPPNAEFDGMPLLLFDDFEDGKADGWEPTDPKAWRITKTEGADGGPTTVFDQHRRKSNFTPPVRSPFNRALARDLVVGNFVLDVRMRSTVTDYNHRSLCLFFGYKDDAHLYYVHFGKRTDDHANQVFVVNDRPRTKISTKTNEGTPWDDDWHHARIVRNVKTGSIAVYFDDMEQPAMTATDKTFTSGRIGIGSFDDTGWFDDVTLWGEKIEPPE